MKPQLQRLAVVGVLAVLLVSARAPAAEKPFAPVNPRPTGNPTSSCSSASKPSKEDRNTVASQLVKPDERVMVAMGGGFLWMIGMFSDLQTVPKVADVWAKAKCAIRMPSAWTVLAIPFKGISINLLPRLQDVTRVRAVNARTGPLYRLPLDLKCGRRQLSRVEMIIGPAYSAEMLLAGIRTIHAQHPTKTKYQFVTQVLATGSS